VKSLLSYLATVCSVVLTVNSQTISIKSQTKPIKKKKNICIYFGFACDFIDFLYEFTVKTTEHTGASYESSDFT
jgi:hypothetical protein